MNEKNNESEGPALGAGPVPDYDSLAPYRERIMYPMSVAGVVFLTPFSINDFVQGRHLLGLATVAIIAMMAINAVALHFKKKPPIAFALMAIPTAFAIALSLRGLGFYGALWTYPAVLFCYFLLARRTANIAALSLSALAAVMIYVYVDPFLTVRFVVSMALTVVIINIILNIVGQLQSELMGQAVTDPLTGAFNRRQMDISLAEAAERHRRTGAPASILAIDIDHFKKVNDDFGHAAGDAVLKGLVTLIRNRTRRLDRLFRMGGEEFLLLLPDTRAGAAMKQADALRQLVADSKLLDARQVTVSIGVAEYQPEQKQDHWLKMADQALYDAKTGGRNRVVCGSPETDVAPDKPTPDDQAARRYG